MVHSTALRSPSRRFRSTSRGTTDTRRYSFDVPGPLATTGCLLTCTMGAGATPLMVPCSPVTANGLPVGTLTAVVPGRNIVPFGVCRSTPPVPRPCTPVVPLWEFGASRSTSGGLELLTVGATGSCAFGGVLTVGPAPGPTPVAT